MSRTLDHCFEEKCRRASTLHQTCISNIQWIKNQNVKGKIVRLIKENIREHPRDLMVGKDLNKTLKANGKTKKHMDTMV